MIRQALGLALVASLFIFDGYATGEVINLHLQATSPEDAESSDQRLSVAVTPFQDLRADKDRLGTRIDFWGGESDFQLMSDVSEATAQYMVDFLKGKGWRVQLVKEEGAAKGSDVVLAGQIHELAVEATGHFMWTEIKASSRIKIEARNQADGSTLRMSLNGAGSQEIFWFESSDAEELLNGVMAESFDKLLSNTKVEKNTLRLP